MKGLVYFMIAGLTWTLLLGGCAGTQGPQIQLTALAASRPVCRIAILPFANETGRRAAAVQAYRIFSNELIASNGYQVVPEGEVAFFLNRNRLRINDLLDSANFSALAQQLEIDTVARGRLIELDSDKGRSGPAPSCRLQVDLLSAEDGQLLARTYHRRSGDDYQKVLHFGTIHTTSGLMAQVSREIIAGWQKKGLKICPEEE